MCSLHPAPPGMGAFSPDKHPGGEPGLGTPQRGALLQPPCPLVTEPQGLLGVSETPGVYVPACWACLGSAGRWVCGRGEEGLGWQQPQRAAAQLLGFGIPKAGVPSQKHSLCDPQWIKPITESQKRLVARKKHICHFQMTVDKELWPLSLGAGA